MPYSSWLLYMFVRCIQFLRDITSTCVMPNVYLLSCAQSTRRCLPWGKSVSAYTSHTLLSSYKPDLASFMQAISFIPCLPHTSSPHTHGYFSYPVWLIQATSLIQAISHTGSVIQFFILHVIFPSTSLPYFSHTRHFPHRLQPSYHSHVSS